MRPEVVTLVTHHTSRPLDCLLHALDSLRDATGRTHLVDLRLQGRAGKATARELRGLPSSSRFAIRIARYRQNTGQVRPIIDSVELAKRKGVLYWAKLDDDGAFPALAIDGLIDAMEDAGPVAYCAMASPNGRVPPRVFKARSDGALRLIKGNLGTGEVGRVSWAACHFVGDGCTVFRMTPFTMGARWDQRFEVSADIDMAMQARGLGLCALMCNPPAAEHQHADCSPESYERVRFSWQSVERTADGFFRKWGVECLHLRNAKPRYP